MSGSEEESVWVYEPNFPLAVIGTIIYGFLFFYIAIQTFRYRSWFFLTVVIGAGIDVVGYAMRVYSALNQTEIAPAAVTQTLIIIAPIFIAAGNFLLVGRLARAVLPPTQHTIFRLPARLITRFFVICDVAAAIVQGSGSSVAGAGNWKGETKDIGEKIIIGGLSFQSLAFVAYLCVFTRFYVTARRMEVETALAGWKRVVKAVYISSSMIMIRCIYRIAEFSEGIEGYAFQNEWLFWVFECIPIAISIIVFCFWYPSKYLGKDGGKSFFPKPHMSNEGSELIESSPRSRRNRT